MVTATPTRCANCGATELRPVPWRRRFTYWFQYGRGGATVQCKACGEQHSPRSFMVMGRDTPDGGRARRLVRTLAGVVEATLRHRTRHPTPRFYVTLGVGALPPALIVGALLPRHRWRILAAAPTTAMLGGLAWSLGSAVNPQTRRAITWQLDPRAAMRRDLDAEVERIRGAAASLVLLQPAGWDGEVAIGGSGYSWSPGGAEHVTEISVTADHGPYGHASPPSDPRRLTLETCIDRSQPTEDDLLEQVAELERSARQEQGDGPAGQDPAELERWFAARDEERRARTVDLAGRWRDATVTIDGAPTPARLIEGDGVAMAVLELGDQRVRIDAVGVPLDGLALVRVADVEALLAVMRERRTAWLDRS